MIPRRMRVLAVAALALGLTATPTRGGGAAFGTNRALPREDALTGGGARVADGRSVDAAEDGSAASLDPMERRIARLEALLGLAPARTAASDNRYAELQRREARLAARAEDLRLDWWRAR